MEETEQKRQSGEVVTDITPEQAANDAEQVRLHYKPYVHSVYAAKLSCASVTPCTSWSGNALFWVSLQSQLHDAIIITCGTTCQLQPNCWRMSSHAKTCSGAPACMCEQVFGLAVRCIMQCSCLSGRKHDSSSGGRSMKRRELCLMLGQL